MEFGVGVAMINIHDVVGGHCEFPPRRVVIHTHTFLDDLTHEAVLEAFISNIIDLKAFLETQNQALASGMDGRAFDPVLDPFFPPLADDGIIGLEEVLAEPRAAQDILILPFPQVHFLYRHHVAIEGEVKDGDIHVHLAPVVPQPEVAASDVAIQLEMIGNHDHLRTVHIDEELLNPAAVLQLQFDPFHKFQGLFDHRPDAEVKAFFIVEEDGVGADLEPIDGDALIRQLLTQMVQPLTEDQLIRVQWIEAQLVLVRLSQEHQVGTIDGEMDYLARASGELYDFLTYQLHL